MPFEHGPSRPKTAPGPRSIPCRLSLSPNFQNTELRAVVEPDQVIPITYLKLEGEINGMYHFTIGALTADFKDVTLTGYLTAAIILDATLDAPLPDDLLWEPLLE